MPGMWEKLFGPGRIDAPEDAAPTELELVEVWNRASALADSLDMLPLAVFVLDGDCRVVHANERACRLVRAADGLAGEIPDEVEGREEQDHDPQRTRPNTVVGTERTGGKQGENDEGQHSKLQGRPHLGWPDPADDAPDGVLLAQGQHHHCREAAGDPQVAGAGKQSHAEDQNGRSFGGPVDGFRRAGRRD